MTDTANTVSEHDSAADLTDRIKSALATIVPEDEKLTVAQLASLDQFHTRGILATTELAEAAELAPSTRVLNLGCGIGGTARYPAATFCCKVIGIDLRPGFIEAAIYLTKRCELSDRVNFQIGEALHLPFENEAFDTVFLQHVAMSIEDRAGLYAEVNRILTPKGRFVIHDIVLRDGDVVYPRLGRVTPLAASCLASSTREWRLNKPGSRRSSGAMTPRARSIGSRRPWLARRAGPTSVQ